MKQVTVLFCDIVGSTSLTEGLARDAWPVKVSVSAASSIATLALAAESR
jgi:class 3 adenylate cyclase